jgi:hypothetical protein
MKVTPKLLRQLAEHVEKRSEDCGAYIPPETIFGWLTEFFADAIEDEANIIRHASWKL